MKHEPNGIGEYSTSPAGQGCLWVAAIGVIGILAVSYMGSYGGTPQGPLDHLENGIAGVTRPTSSDEPSSARHHRRRVRHHAAEQDAE